ncbi:MAG: membrane fusion protein (multidrug efflux system) [Arenicella sp.]|jgi:multidrug efflux pump subunit AcrA (membrane-fusion protein)
MMRKYISVVVAIALLAVGYFVSTQLASSKNKRKGKPKVEKVAPTVFVKKAKNETIPITVNASGVVMAKERIELFAEVQGTFQNTGKSFKSGTRYNRGQVLIRLNSSEQYATLQAQKSTLYNQIAIMRPDLKIDFPKAFPNWEKYIQAFDLNEPVPELPTPTSTKEKVFVSSRSVYNTYYSIKAQEQRLAKYVIRAPFSGILTEALVTQGTLVRVGQQLGEFISTNVFEMEVAVSTSLLPYIKTGKTVKVRSLENPNQTWEARVVRINGKVDRASQTSTVFLELRGKGLDEGLYLEAMIDAQKVENAMEIDRGLLNNDNEIFVVKGDSILKLKKVNPVFFNSKTAVITGLEDGESLLMKVIPGAFEGMPVKVYSEDK